MIQELLDQVSRSENSKHDMFAQDDYISLNTHFPGNNKCYMNYTVEHVVCTISVILY